MLTLAFVVWPVCLQTAHFAINSATDLEKKKGQFRGHKVVHIDKEHRGKEKQS